MLAGTLFSLIVSAAAPQEPPGSVDRFDLGALLRNAPSGVRRVVAAADEHRLQIAFARVDAEGTGRPRLVRETFGDLDRYFYPASSVKLCAAVAALEEINRHNAAAGTSFGLDARMEIGPLFPGDRIQSDDPDHPGGLLTIGGQIRELFLVSDNLAYNRLYELAGPDGIRRCMQAAGFPSLRIHHRLSEFHAREDQLRLRPVTLRGAGEEVWQRPARVAELDLDNRDLVGIEAGRAHRSGGRLVEAPLSFRYKNAVRLTELQDMVVELVRPELLGVDVPRRGFAGLTVAQRSFLRQAMGELPRESEAPRYDPARYPDDYVKFVLPGVRRVLPAERVRVYSKIGRAYGFSTENAYVEDTATGRGFFVAAVVYTNPNGVLNDDDYAYTQVADPFFADLGEALARAVFAD